MSEYESTKIVYQIKYEAFLFSFPFMFVLCVHDESGVLASRVPHPVDIVLSSTTGIMSTDWAKSR